MFIKFPAISKNGTTLPCEILNESFLTIGHFEHLHLQLNTFSVHDIWLIFFTDEKLLSVYCTSLMNLHNCLMYTTVVCNNHDVPFPVPASHITFTRFMVHQERSMYDFVCFDFFYLLRQFWLAEGMVSCP